MSLMSGQLWCRTSEGETLQLWAFLDIDNIQKIMKKRRIFDPISTVKFECFVRF